MCIVARGPSTGAIRHPQLRPGLRETRPSMDPKEMVDDQRARRLLSRRDRMQMMSVLVRGGSERSGIRGRLGDRRARHDGGR